MAIKTYVTSADVESVPSIKTDDREILTTLGSQEEAVAVQLQELFASVTESITASLEVESNVTVEISGSVSLKAQGGVKYLFFNVGAETAAAGSLKVVLATTLKPKTEVKLGGKPAKKEQ